jgi:hypothetical protein
MSAPSLDQLLDVVLRILARGGGQDDEAGP